MVAFLEGLRYDRGTDHLERKQTLMNAITGQFKTVNKNVDAFGQDDTVLGQFVYCSSHRRVHNTGWCTVSNMNKVGLDVGSLDEGEGVVKAAGFLLHGHAGACDGCGEIVEEKGLGLVAPGTENPSVCNGTGRGYHMRDNSSARKILDATWEDNLRLG